MIDRNPGDIVRGFFLDRPRVHLRPGEVLLRKGQHNARLFYVLAGRVVGQGLRAGGREASIDAGPGDLIGVQSFFMGREAHLTIYAAEASELAYVDREDVDSQRDARFMTSLLPVVVGELMRRQGQIEELTANEQRMQAQLRDMERFSNLGQMSAAVAHELNNALAVIARGTDWLQDTVATLIDDRDAPSGELFQSARRHGRTTTTSDARSRARELRAADSSLGIGEARRLAQMGLGPEQLRQLRRNGSDLARLSELWELGATLHDMAMAARQAEHVVTSMKQLGAKGNLRNQAIDVNDSIEVALSILRNVSKGITLHCELCALPAFEGNRGELVQIWTNLIKNACDSINSERGRATGRPGQIHITSGSTDLSIFVVIADNGPGIPDDIRDRIFDPHVTTKKGGLAFGLGLGLSIVQRLVSEYGGEIHVDSSNEGAIFTVTLPRQHTD